MPWLQLNGGGSIGFYDRESERTAGGLSDYSYQRLVSVGAFRRPLNGEAASVTVQLDNGDGTLTELFGRDPPLGRRALVGQGDDQLVSGVVTRIAGAAVLEMTIEGGP